MLMRSLETFHFLVAWNRRFFAAKYPSSHARAWSSGVVSVDRIELGQPSRHSWHAAGRSTERTSSSIAPTGGVFCNPLALPISVLRMAFGWTWRRTWLENNTGKPLRISLFLTPIMAWVGLSEVELLFLVYKSWCLRWARQWYFEHLLHPSTTWILSVEEAQSNHPTLRGHVVTQEKMDL